MGLYTEITTRMIARYVGSQDYGGPEYRPMIEAIAQWENGTGANQADAPPYLDERTIASGASDDIDLSGVLIGPFGTTIAFARMVAMLIINAPKNPAAPRNTTALTIGAGANPWFGFVGGAANTVGPLRPNGAFLMFSGDAGGLGAVTPGTADILRVTNAAGAPNTYQICLIGRTA